MNAHALLTSQGWRGSGNSLHPTDNSIGLSKPLLVSRRKDNIGIGKKAHRTSDMWWMNAFDSSLKGLDTSKEGQVVQTMTSGGLDMVAKGGAKWVGSSGGLYASFVRGECLSGTITPEESAEEVSGKKRKRTGDNEDSKEERRARKAAKKVMEEQLAAEEEKAEKSETKEERRARKSAKRALKEQEGRAAEVEVEDNSAATTTKTETKEERRERKRLKKLAKESRDTSTEDSSEKAKKKKRRKD